MPETRLKVQLLGLHEPDESFVVWMSPKLGDKATFGAIVQAVLGSTPNDREFNTPC